MTTPTIWASCFACSFQYDDTQPGLYVNHLEAHVRAYRDEVKVAAMRIGELQGKLRTCADTLVSVGRELLGGVL